MSQLIGSLDSRPCCSPQPEFNSGTSVLTRGIAALQAGDAGRARWLLTLAVRQSAGSEQAWFWLSAALQTPQGRAFCLQQVLIRNPENQLARRGLEELEKVPRAPALIAQPPALTECSQSFSWHPAPVWRWVVHRLRVTTEASANDSASSTFSRVAKYTLIRALILCLAVVVGVFLAIILINFGGFVDQIYQERINWALAHMAMDMHGMSPEEKFPILEQARWEMEEAMGLHEPFLRRCALWLMHGLTLNWEDVAYLSPYWDTRPVIDVILERLPNTLLLAGTSNLLLFTTAILVALILSRKYGHWLDRILIALSPISSAPNWVYGIILTVIFAAQLRLLPFNGMFDSMPPRTQFGYITVVLKHMILPVTAIVLSMFFQGVYAWRTFFLLHAKEDYVELAEAKGLPPRVLERRYILRPTLPYVLTSFALMIISFWQGAMALEVFFRWPGIGALFVEAVWSLSRTTVISLVVIFAYLLALSVFVLDILYSLLDPRVRVGSKAWSAPVRGQLSAASRQRGWARAVRERFRFRPPKPSRAQKSLRPRHVQYAQTISENTRMALRERLKHLWKSTRGFAPRLRDMARYPSTVIGLATIVILIGVSVYTVITIPYNQAIRLWLAEGSSTLRNPRNAQPEWANLFRRDDLPRTLVLDSADEFTLPAIPDQYTASRDGIVSKSAKIASKDMTEVTISFLFDYPYSSFPQDLAIYLTAHYNEKRPLISLTLLTPDGREIELQQFSITSNHTYQVSADTRLRQRNALGGVGGEPIQKLLAVPEAEPAFPAKGTYELQVTGLVFEDDSDLDAELVLYGQVFGLAGTDHQRRDLMVAMLWGTPVALAFGLAGAVCTSLATMAIAAVGVWFGGWVDNLIQSISQVNMILPALPIAITVYLVYAKSVWVILGIMVLLSVFGSALKNYRSMFLQIKESSYVEAARAYGASNWRIIFRYLVPRIMPVLIPQLVFLIPGYVFLEATLAFLGVSDVYLPTWGKVISDALTNNVFQGHYYWVLEPISLLMLTGLAFAMVGFSLDRIFNPRLREM
jgi:peptide/nickel transport system permease protein